MHKNDRRCGYAAEIYARTQDAQKVNLSARQENIASNRVAQKCGTSLLMKDCKYEVKL